MSREEMRCADPVAVIGIGCRFPGNANSASDFWQMLVGGTDAVTEVPASRWSAAEFYHKDPLAPGKTVSCWGGFIDDVGGFDAGFFGISPREAREIDPQQRLALELAWEALEDAGTVPGSLRDGDVGVYQGIKFTDYEALKHELGPAMASPFTSTGDVEGLVANRVSHFLGLRGPSMTVNASCASSLVAVHLACQALLAGECDLALAGGIQLNLIPETGIALSKLGVLSPTGRCRSFDSNADGYVRGEGGAVVVLKPYGRAVADGDRVYCLIRATASNNNGPNSSLPASSHSGQQRLLQRACRRAGIDPATVDYVEAHGTGTVAGDPVELAALGSVYGAARDPARPLLVGSVKTNIGHLEAAAGVAGLVKLALSLYAGFIPASLHFEHPNPAVDLDGLKIRVAARGQPWPDAPAHPRRGAVSAFGFGGSNAHAILEAAPGPPPARGGVAVRGPHLLVLSARTPGALRAQANRLKDHLSRTRGLELGDVVATLGRARTHFGERIAMAVSSIQEAAERLGEFAADPGGDGALAGPPDVSGVITGCPSPAAQAGDCPRVVFVFPGQGGQWDGMGRELLDTEPAFVRTIESCAAAMRPFVDWSLPDVLRGSGAALNRVDVIQPAVFALQAGVAAVLQERGIRPQAVVGHSMGEIAAAFVSGALNLDEACAVSCLRSRLVRDTAAGNGAMAVVELPAADLVKDLVGLSEKVSIAAVNSPRSTVLSGERAAMERLVGRMEEQGIFTRFVKVDYSSHSPQMDGLRDELVTLLASVRGAPSTVPWYSTVTADRYHAAPDGRYWADNLRQQVRFHDALRALHRDGFDIFVEISPHPLLDIAVREGLETTPGTAGAESGNGTVRTICTLRRKEPSARALAETLGRLHCHGVPLDWGRLAPDGQRISLPAYVFQRQQHWIPSATRVLPGQARHAGRSAAVTDRAAASVLAEATSDAGMPAANPRSALLAMPAAERADTVRRWVVREIAAVLGVAANSVPLDTGFDRLGVSSRLATELRLRLEQRFAATLSSAVVLGHPTARELTKFINDVVLAAPPASPVAPCHALEHGPPPSGNDGIGDLDLIRRAEELLGRVAGGMAPHGLPQNGA